MAEAAATLVNKMLPSSKCTLLRSGSIFLACLLPSLAFLFRSAKSSDNTATFNPEQIAASRISRVTSIISTALASGIIPIILKGMSLTIFDKFWHKTLGRAYKLAKTVDVGQGQYIVMLHGIGRSGEVWKHLVTALKPFGLHIVAFDLLGFGASPKPNWIKYDVDDHANAVIASIENLKSTEPILLVGHSMGCLVAVRVARLRPDLVRHLVLYEMPLHEGLPEKKRYKVLNRLYFRFYKFIMSLEPNFNDEDMKLAEKFSRKFVGVDVTPETWQPLIKSLENTIMNQTAADDIKQINAPMDVIYGSFDMLVIRGKAESIYGDPDAKIQTHKVKARHVISEKAAGFIAERVKSALGTDGAEPIKKSVVA